MGHSLSTPSQSNPNSTSAAAAAAPAPAPASSRTMTPSNSSETHQPEPGTEPTHQPKSPESKSPIQETRDPPTDIKTIEIKENPAENPIKEGNGDEEGEEGDEEEGECGFCLFMKGGGCRDTFTDWENCVEEAEKNKEDIVEKCFQATAALKKCMEAHSDYYAPLLQAEKAAEEEAAKLLEGEKDGLNNEEKGGGESGKKEKEEILDDSGKKGTS